jgi:Archaeal/vacuolar-type H+-ATPase subunit I
MAIVKMKKLRVMAMASDRDGLLDQLLRLGCVEISEPDAKLADPRWAALMSRGTSSMAVTKSEVVDVETALAALEKFSGEKQGMFIQRHPISERDFLGEETVTRAKAACGKINGLLQTLTALQNDESRLMAKRAALAPWKSLDLPLEREGTEHALFRTGVCPGAADVGAMKTALGASGAAAELLEAGGDKQQHYLLLICHRSDAAKALETLRPYNFSLVSFPGCTGTAAQNLDQLDAALAENQKRREETEAAIAACKDSRDTLRIYADRLSAEEALDTDRERLLTDGTIVFFEGWAPASSLDGVAKLLDARGCAWEASDPTPEEIPDVPVKLKNNRVTRALNMVTEMYSLPAYDNVDPNPLMTPFFIFFYGFMMADMGYGFLMMLFSALVLKKYRPKGTMGHFFTLLGYCGISTFIMGVITGGFFGDFLPQIAKVLNPNTTFTALPALFTPLDDTLSILVGSMCLGFVQIVTGMAVSVVQKAKSGNLLDGILNEVAWWVIFAGLALAILGIGNVGGVPVVLLIGGVMMAVGAARGAHGFGKVTAVVSAIYSGVTGFFGDILSYSRLMALMLAGSVIAQVFNTLGAISGNVVIFLIISLLGNTLNFALNLLGCYVHDLRLQCLEFFGKFYQDGGKPFRPLAIDTKYVDVEKS